MHLIHAESDQPVKTKKAKAIHLVEFKGLLFPAGKSDLSLLVENKIPATQFPASTITFLKSIIDKSVTLQSMPFNPVLETLLSRFSDSLPTGAKTKREANTVYVVSPKDHLHDADRSIAHLIHVLGRYCLKGTVQHRLREDNRLTRIELSFDSELPNHLYYDEPALEDNQQHYLQFSQLCRLSLSTKTIPPNVVHPNLASKKPASQNRRSQRAFHLEIQDAQADSFETAMQRTFPLDSLKRSEVINTIKFLFSILGDTKD